MGLYEKNLKAIQTGFPELYERIDKNNITSIHNDFEEIQVFETNVSTKCLCVQMNQEVIRLNSAYDPSHEANVWVEGQEGLQEDNLFLLGMGNGVFASAIIKNMNKTARLAIYEPSAQLFFYALEHFDITNFFQTSGVRVIIEGINEDMYSGVMEEMLTYENFDQKAFFVSPQYGRMFPESRKIYVDGYLDGVGRLMSNRNTIRRFLHKTPYNVLENLTFLEQNTVVPKLAKIWNKEVPVIIVGAGPSLNKELDVLDRILKEKTAYVVAVDSALPFLNEHNITPDCFISIEPERTMEFFCDDYMHIPMFCKLATNEELYKKHTGLKVFGYEDGFVAKLYDKYCIPQSQYRFGGNGATSMFAICKDLGVKTVILVGQDMAYGEDGNSHVGTRNEGYVEEERFRCLSNNGKMVQSRQDWYRFIKWYENAIPACQFEHVINTSQNGAYIQGTEYMSLEEAIQKFGKKRSDIEECWMNVEKTFGSKNFELKKLYCECLEELQTIHKIIEKNSKDEKRKKYLIYELLSLYEVADIKDDFEESQIDGVSKIKDILEELLHELEG